MFIIFPGTCISEMLMVLNFTLQNFCLWGKTYILWRNLVVEC